MMRLKPYDWNQPTAECPACRGRGTVLNFDAPTVEPYSVCDECHGAGRVPIGRKIEDGGNEISLYVEPGAIAKFEGEKSEVIVQAIPKGGARVTIRAWPRDRAPQGMS